MTRLKIKKELEKDLQRQIADHAEHLELREILTQFDGKKLTARVQNKLPDKYKYNGHAIVGPEIRNKENDHRHFVCYSSEMHAFHIDQFDNRNSPYCNGAKERRKQLEEILGNPEKLEQVTNAFLQLRKTFLKFEQAVEVVSESRNDFENPAHYDLLRLMQVPSRLVSDVRFKTHAE